MENASKALIMAGGVLISLMIIGVLVIFFNNLSDWQTIEQSGEETEQVVEFNKQYEVYDRNVYGSELLSVASMVEDYNKREAENKGYNPIELKVTFKNSPNEEIFKKGETYNSKTLLDAVNKIEKEVKKYSSSDYRYEGFDGISSRSIAQMANMRTNDLEYFLFGPESDKKIPSNIANDIQAYNNIKNLVSQIKQKIFIRDIFDYDENTGRIKIMIYHYE